MTRKRVDVYCAKKLNIRNEVLLKEQYDNGDLKVSEGIGEDDQVVLEFECFGDTIEVVVHKDDLTVENAKEVTIEDLFE